MWVRESAWRFFFFFSVLWFSFLFVPSLLRTVTRSCSVSSFTLRGGTAAGVKVPTINRGATFVLICNSLKSVRCMPAPFPVRHGLRFWG